MRISDIETSLSLGSILDKKQSFFLCFAIVLCIALCIVMLAITSILIIIPEVTWDTPLAVAIIFVDVLIFSLFSVLIYIKVKSHKIKKNISEWLNDAIELVAFCHKVDEIRLGVFQSIATKIKVEFKFNNKDYIRFSTATILGGYQGYLGTFNKYSNKVIKIAYSPTYDEVMILKNQT